MTSLTHRTVADLSTVRHVDMTSLTQRTVADVSTARHVDITSLTQRTVAALITVRHDDIRPRRLSTFTSNTRETLLEIYSHADTFCVGKYALVIYEHDRPVTVSGYETELRSIDFKTVSEVLEYTHPLTGQIYHLVIYQAINIPNLDNHFLCPMQCRVNDITINNVSKFLMKTPIPDSHSIVAHDVDNPLTPLVIPLYIHGVTSWLPVYKPSLEDWNSKKYQTNPPTRRIK